MRIIGDALPVATKQRKIGHVKAHQRGKEAPVGLGDPAAEQIPLTAKTAFEVVKRCEQRVIGGLVGGLRLRERAAIDAIIDIGVDDLVEAIDLGT